MIESIHCYSRRLRWTLDLIGTLLIFFATALFARTLLLFLWDTLGVSPTFFDELPVLQSIVDLIDPTQSGTISLSHLQWALVLLAVALLASLLLRNALPTIRTSTKGMLVEFTNGWLPIGWEQLRAVRVTQDVSGQRFILLIEVAPATLTGWHRLYSIFYRLKLRRGILVSSAIDDFELLIRTILSESARIARVVEGVQPVQLDEHTTAPLLGMLLSPAGFFARRSTSDDELIATSASEATRSPVVLGTYPRRIKALLLGSATLLGLLSIVTYLSTIIRGLGLAVPQVARLLQNYGFELTTAPSLIWLLIAAHLLLALGLAGALALRALLPELETQPEGLGVRYFGTHRTVPWRQILAIKDTELSEHNHLLLLQLRTGLPPLARLTSLVYDGGLRPGMLITSAIQNFEPLMQRIVLQVTRAQSDQGDQAQPMEGPLLRSNEHSHLLLLTLRPGLMIDRLVEEARDEDPPPPIKMPRLLKAARPMLFLTLLPTLLLLVEVWLSQAQVPSLGMLIAAVGFWLFAFAEWPIITLLAYVFDEGAQPSEEGYRGLYLYPLIQLPRIFGLVGALLLIPATSAIPGLSVLPILLWLASIVWSFVLSAGLWESLYDWHGTPLLLGGLGPAIYQLFVLLMFVLLA